MTKTTTITATCPNCHQEQEVTWWESLNSTLDPKAKTALLRGEINEFNCVACQKKVALEVPILYHDMEKHYIAKYYPFTWIKDAKFYDDFTPDGEFDLPSEMSVAPYFRHAHCVFSMEELRRYIVFRDILAEVKARTNRT